MTYRKKLIEVALPLEAINTESAREKSIRQGHPSTLHLWWARRPLAACRAVLFASLVDDPSSRPEEFPTEDAQEAERQRLFRMIERLVRWENSNNETVLAEARAEILRSTDGTPPPVLDPFAGGGSIPLEAQRLGLEAHASDLNPVAVLINKALIEIPPTFAGQPPVNPKSRKKIGSTGKWKGAQGLAEDVRYYGKWMRDEAEQRIGHLYPKVQLPKEYGGGDATVIAWLWARTVRCPNPSCNAWMPLVRSFALSTKPGKLAWVEPIVDRVAKTVRFEVRTGNPETDMLRVIDAGTGFIGANGKKIKAMFKCIVCNEGVVKGDYIDNEANKGGMEIAPLALVAERGRDRVFMSFDTTQVEAAINESKQALLNPEVQDKLPSESARGTFASNAQGRMYGFKTFADYFTPRQLVTLTMLSSLVEQARSLVYEATIAINKDQESIANDYADAVATYLGLSVSRLTDICNALCRWESSKTQVRNLFARQAISMMWDFAEPNVFAEAAGDFSTSLTNLVKALEATPAKGLGFVKQLDAVVSNNRIIEPLISTDPPYYGNVSYSELSDFFYVWLRRSLVNIYPDLFSTMLVPKAEELVATPFKFEGDRAKAKIFFEQGMGQAFSAMRNIQNQVYPLTVYYAYRQTEAGDDNTNGSNDSEVTVSTGWETMLEGLLNAEFSITGTWPIRSELGNRPVASGANALASSIVLVCRPRPEDAPVTTRREFIAALRRELPDALRKLQHGNIAPVDLAQAAIGPGMAIFSRYRTVVESTGAPMRVRTALQLINQALDEVLAEQEGAYDNDTRWALDWFTQFGTGEGPYGVAETLSKAKNTSVQGLVEAGVVQAKGGKVTLRRREQLPAGWQPRADSRIAVWEITQQLIRALEQHGEAGAAGLLGQLGAEAAAARDLAYRLYTLCERKGWAQDALAYNSLVVAWPSILEQKIALPGTVGQTQFEL